LMHRRRSDDTCSLTRWQHFSA